MVKAGIVSNAGPLISLARIDSLSLLPALFGEVKIPPAVYREITTSANLPGATTLAQATWLKRVEIEDRGEVERLSFWLDAGEAEALALARELKATVAIDEKRGRRFAAELGVPQTGTVGILLTAKRHGLIPLVRPWLDLLTSRGVRVSARLYHQVCHLAGEL